MAFISSKFKGMLSSPSAPTASTTPPSKEVAETMNALVVGRIPSNYQDGVKKALRKILEEPDHKPYAELIARASHPCVLEYLPELLKMLSSQEASSAQVMKTMKPAELADFKTASDMQKEAYYTGIAELLGRGFTVALKPNLMFDNYGNPIGMREKDRTRFPKCHSTLTGAGRRKTIKKKHQKKRKTLRRRKH